ncbi:MAG: ASPIC/UnbV domain-containing protein [Akkermansiaceae bacterium]
MTPSEKIDDYARGWSGLMKLVRNGHSWSGSERNRFFLNGQKGNFHEMSHLAGLDQIEDGRGIAIVDWDQDGRLDLWYRNRNAPRLRFMHNERDTGHSVAIKLEGTTSNRDGIGAVVELLPSKKDVRLVRSVRAGDLFLSQSSKWLHFGTGNEEGQKIALVTWPGGATELFKGLSSNGRFLLKEGSGKAQTIEKRSPISLSMKAVPAPLRDNGNAQIILPSRVPFPQLTYLDQTGLAKKLPADGRPRLLLLWSADCTHCKKALPLFTSQAAAIRTAQLDVIALSVDGLSGPTADTAPTRDLIKASSFPFQWGLIDKPSATKLSQFHERLFDRTPANSVPLALLLDHANQAIAIYRGEFSIQRILNDWRTLKAASPTQLHHLAPPLRGTWFTNPLPPRDVHRMYRPSQ